jgi:two-component system OmpR family sensor kinase
VAAVAFIALALVAVLVVVARTTEANLVAKVDDQLVDALGPIGGSGFDGRPGEPDRGPSGGSGPRGFPDDPRQPLSPLYIGVAAGDSVETVVEPGLAGRTVVPDVDAEEVRDSAAAGEPFTASTEGTDLRWRVLGAEGSGDGTLAVGLPLDSVDGAVDELVRLEVVAAVVILVALALVALWVIQLGVRPIKRMTAVATGIAGGDLTLRVPESAPGTEAGELGDALNRMLSSIELTMEERRRIEERLRQFVADASHELRTPLATIRGYAELYRDSALDDPDALSDAMRRTEAESIRMGLLVEDLLTLARLDQRRPLDLADVDLSKVATDAVTDACAVAPSRSIELDVDGPVRVVADDARVREVVANLVTNALAHTPDASVIRVSARAGDDAAGLIEVADGGPGMAPDVASRAFERFYRGDTSRARVSGGSGLGLSIVDSVVQAHGGSVSLDSDPASGTTVRVELPSSPEPT